MYALTWLKWAATRLGYVIRPYDMVADRRRWVWQPRQRCGWSYGIGLDVVSDVPMPRPAPLGVIPPDFED